MKSLAKSTLFIMLLLVMLTACSLGKDATETSSAPPPSENGAATNTATENETNEEPDKTQTFKGENFSFSYPSTWKDAELNVPQVVAAFVNPNPQGMLTLAVVSKD